MLGGSEFRLRRGFACGKTLARRKSAAGQKAGCVAFIVTGSKLKISILTSPSKIKGNCESSCLLFWVPAAGGGLHSLELKCAAEINSASALIPIGQHLMEFPSWSWKIPMVGSLDDNKLYRQAHTLSRCLRTIPQRLQMAAAFISKNHFYISIDFNFIYAILNFVKANKKGELIWR